MSTFTPGQAVVVNHQDALGRWARWEGKFLEAINDTVARVQLGGLNVLWPLEHIMGVDDAKQSGDVQVQKGEAT